MTTGTGYWISSIQPKPWPFPIPHPHPLPVSYCSNCLINSKSELFDLIIWPSLFNAHRFGCTDRPILKTDSKTTTIIIFLIAADTLFFVKGAEVRDKSSHNDKHCKHIFYTKGSECDKIIPTNTNKKNSFSISQFTLQTSLN